MSDIQIDNSLPADFNDKTVNNKILLTGAGFSKAFGYLDSSEILNATLNRLQNCATIKNKMLASGENYEDLYGKLKDNDKVEFQSCLVSVFKEMHDKTQDFSSNELSYKTIAFLDLFYDVTKYNFIATLNHDLLIERFFLHTGNAFRQSIDHNKEKIEEYIRLFFPFNDYSLIKTISHDKEHGGYIQSFNSYKFDSFGMKAKLDLTIKPLKERVNYLKIHGSIRWKDKNDKIQILTGNNDKYYQLECPLFKLPYLLFEKITNIPNLHIVIVGYGFKDEHINEKLYNAVSKGAKIYIIDNRIFSDFIEDLKSFPRCNTIKFKNAIEMYSGFGFDKFLQNKTINLQCDFDLLKQKLKNE